MILEGIIIFFNEFFVDEKNIDIMRFFDENMYNKA
jgi:hypothetical protein